MDLAKTQVLSLVTKGVTTALGIIQSVIVVRLLSRGEFGLVGLVMSIGGVIGVSQHLGIVDGAIREIAVLKNRREVGKVFWVSHIARQIVTVPLSVGLFLLAGYIAVKFYDRPDIMPYSQIFALSLILQGLQDVLGATLTGIKKFVSLYVVQIVTAAINIAVFGYLTWRWGITGFFWAVIVTTSIMVVIFAALIARELKGNLALPTWGDIRQYGRRVLRIGIFMYISRIFFVLWQRLPILILGAELAADDLGDVNVSLTFGSKLTIIAMALSEVNLSWMSTLYAREKKEFERVATRNMHRVLVVMLLLTLVMLFFTPEILRYIIGSQYMNAQPLILIMTLAFFLYSLTDIGTSSVFVPADKPKLRMYVYGLMTALTAGLIVLIRRGSLEAAAAVLAGAVAAYIAMLLVAKKSFGISLLTIRLGAFLVALVVSVAWLFTNPDLAWRIPIFILFAGYMLYEAHKNELLPTFKIPWLPAKTTPEKVALEDLRIICFAGSAYASLAWTNRQHIMSRVAKRYPVLYVEPRVWLVRYLWLHWYKPVFLLRFFRRLFWYEKVNGNLYIKAQWNLIPGSREIKVVSALNHYLNRWHLLLVAWRLGFFRQPQAVWIYDTEAIEYLSAFRKATVLYDCVDDHAAQAGVDRNPSKVFEEEKQIMNRADVVTVTSRHLFNLKKHQHKNLHLVLNAGNVELFLQAPVQTLEAKAFQELLNIPHPIIGSVGTIDSYKLDWNLVEQVARQRPQWHFVFIGAPLMGKSRKDVRRLKKMANIHFLGSIRQEDVPAYVRYFNAFVIPYKASKYNEASFPLKFWEFMATGKPIVISGVPELKVYKPLIHYVKNSKDMMAAIAMSLQDPKADADKRIEEARHHTWEKRTAQLLRLLSQAIIR
ncbi:MAG: oligosaccharide flippase family protein [Candidatus Andersenbacteria bacterium]|nr:oligosaccharide flippase family protein [Candidatus Andersenbacteria bacterium]